MRLLSRTCSCSAFVLAALALAASPSAAQQSIGTALLLNWGADDRPVRDRVRALEAALWVASVLGSAALSFSAEPAAPLRRPHLIFPAPFVVDEG